MCIRDSTHTHTTLQKTNGKLIVNGFVEDELDAFIDNVPTVPSVLFSDILLRQKGDYKVNSDRHHESVWLKLPKELTALKEKLIVER